MANDQDDRNRRARAHGFRNAYELRKFQQIARDSQLWKDSQLPDPKASTPEAMRLLRLYKAAFFDKPKTYKRTGPKAEWFVTVAELMDYDEWADSYPGGTRD